MLSPNAIERKASPLLKGFGDTALLFKGDQLTTGQ